MIMKHSDSDENLITMNEYELEGPFQNQDAGFSRWTFAKKGGKKYFLKEFLDPVYPFEDSLSEDLRKQRIRECEEYEVKKRHLYEAVNEASDGNLVRICEYFRRDSHYYISTEYIEASKLSPGSIQEMSFEDRLMLCKGIAHSMMKLHEAHVVHADIKESNIILKRTGTGHTVGKIIDFDSCFFEAAPPVSEDELSGDQIYLAPEACQFICGEPVNLNNKIDVFALGLLFHQYLTGQMPLFDIGEYDYAHEAVLDDQELVLSEDLPYNIRSMIGHMLVCEPDARISMQAVYEILEDTSPDLSLEEEAGQEKENEADGFFHAGGDL